MLAVTPGAAALAFAVLSLAVYRVAVLVAVETGPWHLAGRWRQWVEARRGGGGWDAQAGEYDDWVTEGVHCPWCVAFWLALPAALAWGALTGASPVLVAAAWPAMAAVTVTIWRGDGP